PAKIFARLSNMPESSSSTRTAAAQAFGCASRRGQSPSNRNNHAADLATLLQRSQTKPATAVADSLAARYLFDAAGRNHQRLRRIAAISCAAALVGVPPELKFNKFADGAFAARPGSPLVA